MESNKANYTYTTEAERKEFSVYKLQKQLWKV